MTSLFGLLFGFATALSCASVLLAEPHTPVTADNDLAFLVKTISNEVNGSRAIETMRQVYSTDRWFTFPKFEETAKNLKRRLEESGLQQVEIGSASADGKTQAGFWTMPLAWDVKTARLEMIEPERSVLCDYLELPMSLGMWSGATPKEGITAELVDIGTTPWPQVKGKLVLTAKNSAGYKDQLVKYGALGAVNGFSENTSLENGRQWINAWGDNRWGFTKGSTPLLSFSITPKQANRTRQLLAAGSKVKLRAVVDARYYEGRYPWVTGVLRGKSANEEVLVLGHTSEQGAQDNATGVAAMTEALATLVRLVNSGKLPRPQRSIRILLMPELYGSLSYLSAYPERTKQTVAAMTVDTPAASYDLAGTEYTFYMNPHVAMSYVDALILRIAKACFTPSRPWHWQEFTPGTDSYLGEPTIDVPDVWSYSGTGPVTHHNSEDKPETVDVRSLRDLTAVTASYLYFNASAGESQLPWLSQITLDHVMEEINTTASAALDCIFSGDSEGGSYGLDRIAYFSERGEQAILSSLRLASADRKTQVRPALDPAVSQLRSYRDWQLQRLRLAGAKNTPESIDAQAEKIIIHRKRIGTLPLDDLPQEQWEGYPSGAWDKAATVALYWCDGKRNLAEVIHLTRMELGRTNLDFVGYFRFLQKYGYVEITN